MTTATRLSPPNLEGRPTSSNEEEEEERDDEISSEQDDSDCHCSDDHEDNDDDSDFICSECDDDDDDENSSSSSSSSSACSREDSHLQDHANAFLSFLQERMIMQMIEDNNNNEDDDDDSMSSSHGSMPPLFHKNGKVEVEEDPNAPKCAICFSTRRSLEDLPCCGGKAEETTSTRFCRSCLVKTLRSHQSTIAANTDGILLLCNARNTLVGECPRCRSLIAIPRRRCRLDGSKKKPTGGGGDTILCADFEEAMSFVYHKESLRKHLFTVAFSNPNYIPKDIFLAFDGVTSSADNAVHQLIQWGILNRKKKRTNKKKTETDDDVYTLSASDQVLLRNFMSHPRIRPSFFVESSSDNDDEEKWKKAALLVVSQSFFEGMIYALLTGFKVVRAIRLLNHSMILFWMAYGYVPPPPTTITSQQEQQQQQLSSSSQQHLWLVSLLNIFVACLVIVVVIVVATGAVTVWLAARCVWWILYVPSQQTNSSLSSLQMMMRMGMVGLVVVMLHYCVVWYKVWILVALRQCMKMIVTIVCRKYNNNNKSQFATELVPTMLDGLIVAYVFTTLLLPNFFGLF